MQARCGIWSLLHQLQARTWGTIASMAFCVNSGTLRIVGDITGYSNFIPNVPFSSNFLWCLEIGMNDGVGVYNPGFWGMNIEHGKKYKIMFYARLTGPLNLVVSFTGPNGVGNLASTVITGSASDFSNWTKVETVLEAKVHGFRNDLFQMLIDMKPRFIGFPVKMLSVC